ncbi:MAG: glycoside hydrolase family 108 protein [Pseudomonadota bacterium]
MSGPTSPTDAEIVVQAFSPRYARAARRLIGIEGGHVNDPVDRGGETKFGISLRFLVAEGKVDLDGDGRADFDLDIDGDIDGADVRRLTIGDAIFLFHRCFWERIDCDSWPAPIGEMLFDQAVNGGAKAAKKMLQDALNRVIARNHLRSIPIAVDGALGAKTRAMFDVLASRCGLSEIADAYRDAARARYRDIVRRDPSQKRFLNGWLARADALGAD